MPYRGRALLPRQGVAREAIERETFDQRMGGILRHGVAHGLAAHRGRLEAPGTPPRVEVEATHRRQSHDRREVGRHVGHPGPLPIDLHVRKEGKQLEHVCRESFREVQRGTRGMQLVMGASLDPYELHSTRSTLDFAEALAAHMLELFPLLSDVKINRQWAGMADMTPDFAPIMGLTPVRGFYLDSGWGTWGFKATPVSGKTMSYTVAKDEAHPLIEGFAFDRFARYALTGEKGAASVGH